MILWLETLDGGRYSLGRKADPLPCFRCGVCCTNYLVKLTARDIRVLARQFGVSSGGFLRKYARKTPLGPVLRQTGDRCVFLSYERDTAVASCAVYASRPEVCCDWVPSLYRAECLAGLRKLGKSQTVLLPTEIYASEDDTSRLYSLLENDPRAGITGDPGERGATS